VKWSWCGREGPVRPDPYPARRRTVLLISHRFGSVRSADRIYVLDGGRVVESVGHESLMALGGLYAELFTPRAAAYLG
jgi:ATP-binding cassette, subfamily B, bacterial